MKNKHLKKPIVKEHGIKTPLKKNSSLKSREQLRKKLKLLLDKEQIKGKFSSDKKTSHCEPANVPDGPHKTRANANAFNKKKNRSKSPKVNNATKATASSNVKSKVPKIKSKSVLNKRKLGKKEGSVKKTAKLTKVGKVKNTITKNCTTKLKGNPTPVRKSDNACLGKPKSPPEKIHTKKQANKQTNNISQFMPSVQSKNEVNKGSKQKSNTNGTKEEPKKEKTCPKIHKGPLRPVTSDSESDGTLLDSPTAVEPTAEKNVLNNSQALTPLFYTDEDSDDESYVQSDDYSSDIGTDSISDDYDMSSSSMGSSLPGDCLYYGTDSDRTYELPENVCEDVYIANGTAVKHDLSDNNEIGFDSDTSCAQVIEISTQCEPMQEVKSCTTNSDQTNTDGINTNQVDGNVYESDDSCPQLVPIDSKSFTLDSCSESCSECSECFSTSGPYSEPESEGSVESPKMTPAIFHFMKANKQDFEIDFLNAPNRSTSDCIAGSPLDRIANPNANTNKYKVITTNNENVSTEPSRKNTNYSHDKQISSSDDSEDGRDIMSDKQSNRVTKKEPMPNAVPVILESDQILKKTPLGPSFQTLFFNAINSNHVIVLLKDSLYIYGTVKFKLIAGSAEIFGYRPKRNEVLEIFSPRGCSSIQIEPSKNPASEVFNENDLLSLTPFFIQSDLKEIIRKFDKQKDAIVILERNDRSKQVKMLKKYMVEHLFPNMNAIQSNRPFYTSEFLLRCMIMLRNKKPLVIDPKWRTISVSSNSRLILIGGKSVGKSTLVRYLINKHLKKYPKMLLIDLDIGQPEIFVPQTVSATTLTEPLLGPGYFLNKEPDKAFLVGQTNVVFLPQRYIENVQALIKYCNENADEYGDIPWIVNTMGYNKGFGDELIGVICNLVNPTNVIQIESKREINNFDIIMSKENVNSLEWNVVGDMYKPSQLIRPQHQFTLMNSVIPNDKTYQQEWDMNPRDIRLAMIISRLSHILTGHAEWLTDIKPVCASIDDLKIINIGDDNVNTEDLLKTLVGNLVYLCKQGSAHINECFGIGIVRGVDYPLKQIYLLPAVPMEVLTKVNCLAVCGIPLPSSFLINQGPKVRGVASYVYNTLDKAASMHIKQIYHRPQHFLTGRHKFVVE